MVQAVKGNEILVNDIWFEASKYRLATPEEIEAGYRTDIKSYKVGDFVLPFSRYSDKVCELVEDLGYDFKYKNKDGGFGYIVKSFLPTAWRHATPNEIEAGFRIDEDVVPVYANPQFAYTVLTGAQVGSVLQFTPQIDDMGDDSNLDHHVSPFCEVRDV
ncbi:hypothetical protein [Acinetobacter baumannii]|nr:hypothetical protein [Acinetobacter baumannii]